MGYTANIIKILLITFAISLISVLLPTIRHTIADNTIPQDKETITLFNNLFNTTYKFSKTQGSGFFKQFADMQNPSVTLLTCSDSRVHLNSFNDTPQNTVFTIRNIGNQIVTNEGSIDYGVEVLETKYLLILGHSDCGAVKAKLEKVKTNIKSIDGELTTIDIGDEEKLNLKHATVNNINKQVTLALEKYNKLVDTKKLTIIGAIYDFKNEYGFGYGKIVITNVNGHTDYKKLTSTYENKVKNLTIFDNNQ